MTQDAEDECPEACYKSPDGWHCYCWYDQDEPCCHCQTTDLNLWVDGVQQTAQIPGYGDTLHTNESEELQDTP